MDEKAGRVPVPAKWGNGSKSQNAAQFRFFY